MKIALYGDSTQQGSQQWPPTAGIHPTENPVNLLQMRLDHKYGKNVHTVVGYGVSGQTIVDAFYEGQYPGGLSLMDHIAADGADMIIANWGINDTNRDLYTAAKHKTNFTTLKTAVEALNKIFFWEAANPVQSVNYGSTMQTKLQSYMDAVTTIPGIKKIDQMTAIKSYYPLWANHLDGVGIHPNNMMYGFKAYYMFNCIDPYIPPQPL